MYGKIFLLILSVVSVIYRVRQIVFSSRQINMRLQILCDDYNVFSNFAQLHKSVLIKIFHMM
jgi:hypothetical protein